MSLEWLDTYQIDESLVRSTGAPQYPVIAWNTMEYGGMVAEVEKLDGFDCLLPWPVEAVKFGRGAKATRKDCYATRSAEIAILATKTRWYDRATGERIDGYREGAYSRLQLLALVKGGGDKPYMLTVKGVAAGLLAKALTAVRQGPIAAGRRATGKPLAEATFWVTLRAAPAMTVGQQQATEIVPPAIELPGKGEDPLQWLGARYIGPELLAVVNSLAEEATTWANSDAGGNGHGAHEATAPAAAWHAPEEPDDLYPPDDFDALPSASAEPAQAQALATAGKAMFWDLARARGLAGNSQTEIMARAAEVSGNWTAAIAWLQGGA
jgi:hypothetical protein